MTSLTTLTAAIQLTEWQHRGQVRKYTGEPYISHPLEVMHIVATITDNIEILAAAVLHDVVEDCDVKREDIKGWFGERVASMVDGLTDVSVPSDGNRKTRKAIDRQHTALQCPDTKTIKLADLISNTQSITAHDPKFAAAYMAEKKLLLEVLTEGNETLYAMASKIVSDYYRDAGYEPCQT